MGKKLKNFGVYSLMVGVSSFAMTYIAAKQEVPELTKVTVHINNKSMSLCNFCEKLAFEDSAWVYIDESGGKIKVDVKDLRLFDEKGRQKLKDQLNEENIERKVLAAKMIKTFHLER